MKLRALDTVHISALQSDNLVEGDEFEIDDAFGQSLIDRGIAKKIGDSKPAKAASEDKSEAPVENKGAAAAKAKAPVKAKG